MQLPLNLIASPLNYMGGKYKLLSQILPLFPDDISTFVDLFCGGCNVAANVRAQKVICNDNDKNLIDLLSVMKSSDSDEFALRTKKVISDFGLSDSSINGYAFYDCESSSGLGKFNRERFLRLRENFNSLSKDDDEYFYKFFTLIVFSFNNQIRFNSKCEFNLPVGKRDFNLRIQKKLKSFIEEIQRKNVLFTCKDFLKFDVEGLSQNDFVYCDPPYLITTATYNEKNGWTKGDEKNLLGFLDSLSERKVKFALSNVLKSNGKENVILKDWILQRGYYCSHLDFSYKNSNYHKKASSEVDEVLVRNFK